MTLIYGPVAEFATSCRTSGLRDKMVMLNFKPEVEMWQFHACTMKIIQYNAY